MKTYPYTYCVVRYVHDPSAGERLNIGVLLYAPDVPFLGALVERRYGRLSKIFADFDGEHYRRSLCQFEDAVERLRQHFTQGMHGMWDHPKDAGKIGAMIWPDAELSFQIGPVLAGGTSNPAQALESIYHRMVTSQHERPETIRRSDDDIWALYQRPLNRESIGRVLKPKKFETDAIDLEFQHAFKNERWHALQPMSMDYLQVESIRKKASLWLGNAVALKDNPEFAKLYLLLGPPQLESHQAAYTKAKNLLHKMPIPHEFIEEDEAENFAHELKGYMSDHGVLVNPQDDLAKA